MTTPEQDLLRDLIKKHTNTEYKNGEYVSSLFVPNGAQSLENQLFTATFGNKITFVCQYIYSKIYTRAKITDSEYSKKIRAEYSTIKFIYKWSAVSIEGYTPELPDANSSYVRFHIIGHFIAFILNRLPVFTLPPQLFNLLNAVHGRQDNEFMLWQFTLKNKDMIKNELKDDPEVLLLNFFENSIRIKLNDDELLKDNLDISKEALVLSNLKMNTIDFIYGMLKNCRSNRMLYSENKKKEALVFETIVSLCTCLSKVNEVNALHLLEIAKKIKSFEIEPTVHIPIEDPFKLVKTINWRLGSGCYDTFQEKKTLENFGESILNIRELVWTHKKYKIGKYIWTCHYGIPIIMLIGLAIGLSLSLLQTLSSICVSRNSYSQVKIYNEFKNITDFSINGLVDCSFLNYKDYPGYGYYVFNNPNTIIVVLGSTFALLRAYHTDLQPSDFYMCRHTFKSLKEFVVGSRHKERDAIVAVLSWIYKGKLIADKSTFELAKHAAQDGQFIIDYNITLGHLYDAGYKINVFMKDVYIINDFDDDNIAVYKFYTDKKNEKKLISVKTCKRSNISIFNGSLPQDLKDEVVNGDSLIERGI